jgi:hypothetical protein
MIITSKELRKELKKVWGRKLKYIWIHDPTFYVPIYDEIVGKINNFDFQRMRYIAGVYDCEDSAKALDVYIKLKRADDVVAGLVPQSERYPYPIGHVDAIETRGIQGMHSVVIFYCDRGVFLVEGKDGRIWKADRKTDKIIFVDI